jgi:DNA invertase Pin-like site-specific DNA recombinase
MITRRADSRTAVAYLRVSTEDQRLGPDAQRAAIESWATGERIRIVAWHSDQGVSGGSDIDARPALVAALAALRVHRAGVLVVAKRDRLARNVYVAATIERAVARIGARVSCADGTANGDTPADEFMRTILDGAAAYERALIRARTKAALQAKRLRGERVGKIPFGFRLAVDEEHVEPHPKEQLAIEAVLAMRARGDSIRKIAAECVRRKIVSRSGKPLGKTQVERIVRRGVA